jgi:hypothetical protein
MNKNDKRLKDYAKLDKTDLNTTVKLFYPSCSSHEFVGSVDIIHQEPIENADNL